MRHASKLNKLWLTLLIFILLIYIGIGLVVFRSGALAHLEMPDFLSFFLDEKEKMEPDPRVEAYEVDGSRTLLDKVRDVFQSEAASKKGQIKIKSVDKFTKKGIKGMGFEIKEAYTDKVVETLYTDASGVALSAQLSMGSAYTIAPKETVSPYPLYRDPVYLKVTSPLMKVTLKHRIIESVQDYEIDTEGKVLAKEVDIDFPVILQNPELPNGCEVTAMAALLNYYGYPVKHTLLSDQYLPKRPLYSSNGKLYGPHPDQAFSGDPRSPYGWYSYAPPTVIAANTYLKEHHSKHVAIDKTGISEDEVIEFLNREKPLVLWVTRDMDVVNYNYSWVLDDGSKTVYKAASNLHAVVITGYNEREVKVMDPLKGTINYDRKVFFKSYQSLNQRAIVIEEVNE